MLIGKIDFDDYDDDEKKNSLFKKMRNCWCILEIRLMNNFEYMYDYYFERTHQVLICEKCGQKLVPCVELGSGPKSCGWVKNKKTKRFICHQCEYHDGYADGSKEERIAWRKMLKEKNQETERKMYLYKLNHPWVRFKER